MQVKSRKVPVRRQVRRIVLLLAVISGAAWIALSANGQDYAEGETVWHGSDPAGAEQIWRRSGWQRDDYASQFKLANLYGDPAVKENYDPVEAYVWYYLVIINRSGGSPSQITVKRRTELMLEALRQRRSLFNDKLGTRQRIDAQDRLIYILACRGAEGLLTLGQLYDERVPNDQFQRDRQKRRNRRNQQDPDHSELVPSARMAQIFYTLAMDAHHPDARGHLNGFDKSGPSNDIRNAADRWMKPYELYPGKGYPGRRYTDYCVKSTDARKALQRTRRIRLKTIQTALKQLGFYTNKIDGAWGEATETAIRRFEMQADLPPAGKLTPALKVQIMQTAAILGLADAQNKLGVMYFWGRGVEKNRLRAHYWFEKAAAQNHPAGLYHLSMIYKAGVRGVPKDPHKAQSYFAQSAYAGFKKSHAEIELRLHSGTKKNQKSKYEIIDPQYGN